MQQRLKSMEGSLDVEAELAQLVLREPVHCPHGLQRPMPERARGEEGGGGEWLALQRAAVSSRAGGTLAHHVSSLSLGGKASGSCRISRMRFRLEHTFATKGVRSSGRGVSIMFARAAADV